MNAAILLFLGIGWLMYQGRNNDQSGDRENVDSGNAGYTFRYLGRETLGQCFDKMDTAFLIKVDRFMEESKGEWMVSPAPGATCRDYGSETSRHYAVGRLADAIDIMLISGDLEENYRIALERFGGVGVYPDWQPYPGLHIDGRPGAATWAGIKDGGVQVYVPVDEVFV
ncbi:MAG: hypothetical protein AB2687_00470 [Candidatus Thiodiazotropha taylori]